jgi:hypothetical protein
VGKACIRFRSLDDLPLPLVGEAIRKVGVDRFIAQYEASRAGRRKTGEPGHNRARAR